MQPRTNRDRDTETAASDLDSIVADAPPMLLSDHQIAHRQAQESVPINFVARGPTLSAATLATLFMHLPCGVIVLDFTGSEVFANEAGTRLSREIALFEGSVACAVPADQGGRTTPVTHGMLIANVLAGDTVPSVDYSLSVQGAAEFQVVQVAFTALRDDAASITGAVLTLTDVTERANGEARLAWAANALAEVTRKTEEREAEQWARKAEIQAHDNRQLARSNKELEQQITVAWAAGALAQVKSRTKAREAVALARKAGTQALDNRDLTLANIELESQARLARAADAEARLVRESLAREASELAREVVTQALDNRELVRTNVELETKAKQARAADARARMERENLIREANALAREAVTRARDNRELARSNSDLERLASSTRTEIAALEAERAAVIEQLPSGVMVLDDTGHVVTMNLASRRILGTLPNPALPLMDQLAGLHQLREPITGRLLAPKETPIARALTGDVVHDYWYTFRRHGEDGSTWIRASAVPLRDADDRVTGVVSVFSDVTHEQTLVRALKASEDRFKAFMDNSPVLAIMKDERGRYVYVNATYERLFQRTFAEISGKTDAELWPSDSASVLRDYDLAAFEADESLERVISLPTAEGQDRQWLTFKFKLRDLDGRPLLGSIAIDITDRRLAEQRKQRHFDQLSALRTIDMAITTSLDLRLTLGIILDQLVIQLGIDAGRIYLLDAPTQLLKLVLERGCQGTATRDARIKLGEGAAGRAANERRRIVVPDLTLDGLTRASTGDGETFVRSIALPLQAKGQLQGVLEIFLQARSAPDSEWLEFLETLAGQAAIAIDNAGLFDDLQRSNNELTLAYDTTIEGWSRALDLRDKETEGHSRRVTEQTLVLARALGVPEEAMPHVRRGALLHDIGKMGIPDQILLKPGPLTEDEWTVMRRHPQYAFELLSPITYLRDALDIPHCHHERWDGTGYPRGLKGRQIPFAARVFAVVDIWDALLSDRPYRPGWSLDQVCEHIRSLSGTHFDPKVVKAFLELLEQGAVGTMVVDAQPGARRARRGVIQAID